MHKKSGFLTWIFVFMTVMFLPSIVFADSIKILHVSTPEEATPAEEAKVSVYFDARQSSNASAIVGIKAEDCSILIDGKKPEVVSAEMREFKSGDQGVGILFIFPIAKNYSEESFGIRAALSSMVQMLDRPIDMVNAVPYDITSTSMGWSKASDATLSRAISELQTTEVIEPNLFSSFTTAITQLTNLQNVSQKYVVIITDAEGAIVGDSERAIQLIGAFTDELKKSQITPIVIGYSPDGMAAMNNIALIKRIATNSGGLYLLAENQTEFQQRIQRDVYDYIYKRYIYDATLDMTGDNYLDAGKYNLQLVVKTATSEEKAGTKITWPELKKNNTWLWVTITLLVLLGAGVGVFFVIARNRNEEEEYIEEGPQEVCCATCGKPIPQQLYGFNGEFCLSGGLPDCPYYQMPDRGKIQITRGAMADTTFFIKKDMTTIGSYPENDIFLADKSVSRKHAAIKTDEGKRYEIRDFGSSNGLYINNEKTERKFLRNGDIIRFGTVETVFKLK